MGKIVMVTKCPICESHDLSAMIDADDFQQCNSCGFAPIPWSWSEVETNEHARRRRVFDVDDGTLRLLLQVTDIVKANHARYRSCIKVSINREDWDLDPRGDWSVVSNDPGLLQFMVDLLRAIGVPVSRVQPE